MAEIRWLDHKYRLKRWMYSDSFKWGNRINLYAEVMVKEYAFEILTARALNIEINEPLVNAAIIMMGLPRAIRYQRNVKK